MEIVTDPEVLRQRCEDVTPDEVHEVVCALTAKLDTMPTGIGLAAPQIGIKKRVAIVRVTPADTLLLINPRLVGFYKAITWVEGCLSFPGQSITTKRWDRVKVSTLDIDTWEPTYVSARGLKAVCIQHELDHLNGVLFFDHAAD